MSIEWDSVILGSNELNTGSAIENARRANSVRTHGTNSIGAMVNMSWSYGGVDVACTLWVTVLGHIVASSR